MFKNILVSIDGWEPSSHALDVAVDVAKQYGARLKIVHAVMLDVSLDALMEVAERHGFLNQIKEDIDEATAQGKRLMLFFHQAGCPYCNALVEDNLAQPDIEQTVRDNLDVVAINMWGDLEVVQVGGRQFTKSILSRRNSASRASRLRLR